MDQQSTDQGSGLRIAERFCGPSDSGNGGYVSGLIAAHLGGPACITLRSPPPLGEPLRIQRMGNGGLTLLDGDLTVAEAEHALPAPDVPAPVGFTEATAASADYRWRTGHPYPDCFVCGTDRGDDALRIFAGPVPGRDLVAAPWVPESNVCGTDGRVLTEVVWAALDCPSGFGAITGEAGVGALLLGRFTVVVHRRPARGEQCVVTGWSRGREGRKRFGGSALFSADGELYGTSEAIWIIPKTS